MQRLGDLQDELEALRTKERLRELMDAGIDVPGARWTIDRQVFTNVSDSQVAMFEQMAVSYSNHLLIPSSSLTAWTERQKFPRRTGTVGVGGGSRNQETAQMGEAQAGIL